MQRYCRPAKAIDIGGRLYKTPGAAAKQCAWFITESMIAEEYQTVRKMVCRQEAGCGEIAALFKTKRARLYKKATRRVLPIMQAYFA